jgi:hypothetical protein
MPVRSAVAAIILFWLAAMSWLFYREIRPRLWPNEPPRLTFTLEDEAQRAKAPQQWELIWNGVDLGYTESHVDYDQRDDTFALNSVIKLWTEDRGKGGRPVVVIELMYRVTRETELREIAATATTRDKALRAEIGGPVQGGMFRPHVRICVPKNALIKNMDEDLDPIRVAERGYVLDPLEPMNRLPDVRPGQHWEMPLSTPADEIISGVGRQLLKRVTGLSVLDRFMGGGTEFPWVEARVLPEAVLLQWPKRRPGQNEEPVIGLSANPAAGWPGVAVPLAAALQQAATPLPHAECYVVQYDGESHGMKVRGRTWVRVEDGAVLQQEVSTGEAGSPGYLNLTLERDLRMAARRDDIEAVQPGVAGGGARADQP